MEIQKGTDTVRSRKVLSIGAVITRANGEVVDLGVIGGSDLGWVGKVRAFLRIKRENRRYRRQQEAKEG